MASAHEAPRPGPPDPATAPSRDVTLSLLHSHLFAFSLGFALLIAVLGHHRGRLFLLPVLLLLLFGAFGSAWGWRGSLFAPYPGRGTSQFTRDTHASPGRFPQPQGSNPSSLSLERNKKGEDPVLRPHGLFKWASRCPQVFRLENLLLTPSRPHPPLHSDN